MIGFALQPERPNLAGDRGYREQSAQYRPGGSKCEPAAIEALSRHERSRRADACAEAEEQHREATDTLVEARRSADTADAATIAAYNQTRIAAWSFGAGLVTLFAAVAAAVFAERAAHHTRRAADLSEKELKNNLRAWISIDVEPSQDMIITHVLWAYFKIKLTNIGGQIARDVRIAHDIQNYCQPDTRMKRLEEIRTEVSSSREQSHWAAKKIIWPGQTLVEDGETACEAIDLMYLHLLVYVQYLISDDITPRESWCWFDVFLDENRGLRRGIKREMGRLHPGQFTVRLGGIADAN